MTAANSSSAGGYTGVSRKFSPTSVRRKRVPGLSRLLFRNTSGNASFPSAVILTVVVTPKNRPAARSRQ
jgi:hypothetical protein